MVVIISKKYGQLGNRLFLYSHIIANSIEHHYTVINTSFEEYCDYFEETVNSYLCSFPPKINDSPFKFMPFKKFTRVVIYYFIFLVSELAYQLKFNGSYFHKIVFWDNFSQIFYLTDQDFLNSIRDKKIIFLGGWLIRDPAAVNKNSEIIKQYFSPRSDITARIIEFIERERSQSDFLIGIHIRRGDYKEWREGRYYFSLDDYREIMEKLKKCYQGKNIKFIICSNEEIKPDILTGFNCTFGLHKEIEDMYSLAKCDLIVGPPSSYTMWASFYGNIPLLIITNPHQPLNIEHAKVIKGEDMHHLYF